MCYHMNQSLFPTEYRSKVSGTINFIGRGFTALSIILVEYTTQPIMFVLILCLATFFSISGLIRETPEAKK